MTRADFIERTAIALAVAGMDDQKAWDAAVKLADARPQSLGPWGAAPALAPAPRGAGGGGPTGDGATFPNFGKTKNQPVFGASEDNLRYYAHAAVRTLEDASQSKWHAKERERLAAYVAELERQGHDASEFKAAPKEERRVPSGPPSDEDIPF